MAKLSDKKIIVFDLSGSYTHVAERLAEDFGHVYYHTLWQTGFSKSRQFLPGYGLDNIERIANFFSILDRADICFFTDVGYGDLQEYLREQGYPVFGSGAAQILEIDRMALKQALLDHDMETPPAHMVKGTEALKEFLSKVDDVYVKFSYFRGDMETYHHKDLFATETWLNNLEVILGPYSREAVFLVEEPIQDEACEVGYDGFSVDGRLPQTSLWGYEIKDAAYIGCTTDVPRRLEDNTIAFTEIFAPYNYRGIFSTEVKMSESECNLIDVSLRCPSPPSEVQCASWENISECIWEGAHGNLVEPIYRSRFGAMLVLKSDWIIEHPMALSVDDPDRVFVHGHFKIDGKDYACVPEEFAEFAGAVGIGDNLDDAIGEAIEAAKSVSAYQLHYDESALTEGAMECIENGEKMGLQWPARSDVKRRSASNV